MRKTILFAAVILIFCPQIAFSETVSLSTYYPAPYGTYDRLRLVPRPDLGAGPCRVGTLYIEDTNYRLRYCRDVGAGPDNGAWGFVPELWNFDEVNNEIFLSDGETNPALQVGIKDESPDAALEVSDSGQGQPLFMLSSDDDQDGDLFTVDAIGNVGIGTNTPGEMLSIATPGAKMVMGLDAVAGSYGPLTTLLEINTPLKMLMSAYEAQQHNCIWHQELLLGI